MGRKHKKRKNAISHFRFIDFLIIVFCLSVMAYSINLFRLDLSQTISLQNVQPVGVIIIKNNIVQRRIADRVLWDRLSVESPVYLGDIIRVAALSSTTLNIENQQIDIEENTLIRIQLASDGSGALQIELSEGSLALTSPALSSPVYQSQRLQLNLMGRIIETEAGTALTAAAGKDGVTLQVNEGAAVFIEEGASREVLSGTMIALDSEGIEQRVPSVVVSQPRPNARYVKSTPRPLFVTFAWNRVNLQPQDTLRLEIAADGNFNHIVQSVQNLVFSAEISLEAGLWNWRLSHEGVILAGGRLTVVETSNLNLLSPAKGSLFRYQDEGPSLRFQWSEIEEASHYVIEIASTPDFANPRINRQIAAPFFVDSTLTEGTWYWRVRPVFSSAYEGGASFSPASFFVIEQIAQIAQTAQMAGEQAVTLLEGALLFELEQSVGNETPAAAASPVIPALAEIQPSALPPPAAAPARSAPQRPQSEPQKPRPATTRRTTTAPQQPRPAAPPPPPLLPAPENREPANNYHIGIEQLKAQRNIVFSWAAVQGANAYILTLYGQTINGRRQIIRTDPLNRTGWTLDKISVLDRGNFVWQVEAVYVTGDGTIEHRGETGENSFVIDIPVPEVHLESPGVLYGF